MRNQNSWDEKYAALLQKLDDYQEEKDNPRKQVVDMDLADLCVHHQGELGTLGLTNVQFPDPIQIPDRAVRAARAPFPLAITHERTRSSIQPEPV